MTVVLDASVLLAFLQGEQGLAPRRRFGSFADLRESSGHPRG
jgi:hypothetical protein